MFEPAEKARDLIQHDLRLLAMGSVPGVSEPHKLRLRGKGTQRFHLQTGCVFVVFPFDDEQRAAYRRQVGFERQCQQAVGVANAEPCGETASGSR